MTDRVGTEAWPTLGGYSPVPPMPEQKAEALAVTFGRVLFPLTPAVMPAPTTASQALAPAPLTLAVRKPPTTSSTG